MRRGIRFLLGREKREIGSIDPTLTVLRYLREHERLCGTKEGCAEGDCGACTVVIGEPGNAGIVYRAVNSCIQFMPLLDGKQLITVEHLADEDGTLHPAQQAMCDHNASQCGFCTPGFVMSLFAQFEDGAMPGRAVLKDVLAGNLCRCTGYGPILDAGEAALAGQRRTAFSRSEPQVSEILLDWRDATGVEIRGNGRTCFAPRTADDLAGLCLEHPDAHIIAGLTDVGLWVTKQHRDLATLIHIGNVRELQSIDVENGDLSIGAAVSFAQAHAALAFHYPDLGELIRRFASLQIRNVATLCGNVANGSPIGDLPPALIALGGRLVLRRGGTRRTIALEDFFLEYGRQDRAPGEFVERILVPLPADRALFACYKISKRFDQDISAVCGAFRLVVGRDRVEDIRICYGGMAGIPARAAACERALRGQAWNEAAVGAAMDALPDDFEPITDMRASAAYRMHIARNLLFKFFVETSGATRETRVLDRPMDANG